MSEDIRIYVADLAAYNNGILHGVWIDVTQELDDIWDQVNKMLKASPIDEVAEEYAIHGATRSRIQRVGVLPPSNLLDGSQPRSAC